MNKFLYEIMEQPVAIGNVIDFYSSKEGKRLLKQIEKLIYSEAIELIVFTGMGSSYFISFAAANLFNQFGIHSVYINTSELLHYNLSLIGTRTLLICMSQSGESFEIREILDKLPEAVFCIGIVNEENSTLAQRANIALLCKGGKEEMTSTKTYVVTSLVAYILGSYLVGQWGVTRIKLLRHLQRNFEQSLSQYNDWLPKMLDFMGDIRTLQIIARGPSFSTASQSALMFKEATHIAATGILGGEFRHGSMEMVENGFKSILFAAEGRTFEQSLRMAEDIAEFGGKVLLITNFRIVNTHANILPVYIDEKDEFLFSIQSIIPMQLFIDEYAKRQGFEAGKFFHGAKVTMIE